MSDHEPVLSIFRLAPEDGSIQAGGPLYTCQVCRGQAAMVTDVQGRTHPVHVDSTEARYVRAIYRAELAYRRSIRAAGILHE